MRFTSCIPALDVLTLQFDSLSKPVDPKMFQNFYVKSKKDDKNNTNFNSFVCFVPNTIYVVQKIYQTISCQSLV